MANYFVNLPAPTMPRNALMDYSPIDNALDGIRQQRNVETQRDDMLDQRRYQRGREQTADARQQVEWFGRQAAAVDRITDQKQREATWAAILSRHPNAAGLDPSYTDPINGPKAVMAEAGQWRDPRDDQMKNLEIQKTQAQIGLLQRKAATAGEQFGKAGTIVQDRDGKFYSVQFGANGQKRVEPLAIGENSLQPSRGVDQVGNQLVDKATGTPVRDITGNIQAGEQAKVLGRETAERQIGAPKAQAALAAAEAKSDLVLQKIDQAMPLVSNLSTGFGGALLKNIPATAAKDLSEIIKTIVANSGFSELQTMRDNSPTGGALGQVAVQELEMLQKTITSLDQAQSMPQVASALREMQQFYQGARSRRRAAYDATYGGAAQQQITPPSASGNWSIQRVP